ncbi:hypothetical protein OG440_00775 [Streptomyces sp. NBC_00637]|uniref:hypothetical protein n=1 Tax=Streptomyces sp. NBC_00637 TaxID=2903667 RepID=UPI003246E8EC
MDGVVGQHTLDEQDGGEDEQCSGDGETDAGHDVLEQRPAAVFSVGRDDAVGERAEDKPEEGRE